MNLNAIVIVSGLPRSGTSMMMQLLEAGGLPILKDDLRAADPDNPKGYYEFEQVKQIERDQTWLENARGQAVKMVSALLLHLPNTHTYKVIFMRRHMDEILASQKQMLIRQGKPADAISDQQMARLFHKHLDQVIQWLEAQPNFQALYIHYHEVIADPRGQIERINSFLGGRLDADQMASAVDRALYRQRSAAP
jgi:hypothetical protein